MPWTTEQLLTQVRLGEHGSFGLKEVAFSGKRMTGPEGHSLADELASFANAHGGSLILGVNEKTQEISGIPTERFDAVERRVSELVTNSIDPPLGVSLERHEAPDSTGRPRLVLRVVAPRSDFVHRSPGGYFRRIGNSKRDMNTEELCRLLQNRVSAYAIRFDGQVIRAASVEDLAPALIERFRIEGEEDDNLTLAGKRGMVGESEEGDIRPTVAGILLASANPQQWLPHAFIQAVAYRGREVAESLDLTHYQLDARDIGGPLDRQIEEACHFVARNQKIAATKTVGRFDIPQYDMASVYEALMNAVVHRDYSVRGSHIRLQMFCDRLEIYSPGGLLHSLSVETLQYHRVTRNCALASLLADIEMPSAIPRFETQPTILANGRDGGVRGLLRQSEELSGRRPQYRLFDESELLLTIFAAGPNDSGYVPAPAE